MFFQDGASAPRGTPLSTVTSEVDNRYWRSSSAPSFESRITLARETLVLFSTLILSTLALAEGTRTWEQSKFEDLTKGTAKGIALRSTGGLELAPAFKSLATTASTYLWSITSDSAGNIYAAAGSPARVYRITPDGQSTTIFEPQELQVQSLVVDKNNVVYAATAPAGKD